jgi:hypothetical protein
LFGRILRLVSWVTGQPRGRRPDVHMSAQLDRIGRQLEVNGRRVQEDVGWDHITVPHAAVIDVRGTPSVVLISDILGDAQRDQTME